MDQRTQVIAYLPREAAAEVSNHKEPIGRGRVEFNWFESELTAGSNGSGCQLHDLGFKRCGCQVMWDSNDLGCRLVSDSNECSCQLICDSNDLVVSWFEIQLIWLSIDLRFKRFGCQLIGRQAIWLSDLRFK